MNEVILGTFRSTKNFGTFNDMGIFPGIIEPKNLDEIQGRKSGRN